MQIQTDAYPLFPIAQESQQTAPPRGTTKRKVLPFFPQSTIEEKKNENHRSEKKTNAQDHQYNQKKRKEKDPKQ